jgi:hypothetical protein
MTKFGLILLFILGMGLQVKATESTIRTIVQDSLPSEATAQAYRGYRLHLSNVTPLKSKDGKVKLGFHAINTGRENLRFGKNHLKHHDDLLIEFDEAFEYSPLFNYKENIKQALLHKDMVVMAGKILYNQEIDLQQIDGGNKNLVTSLKSNNRKEKKKKEEVFTVNTDAGSDAYFDKSTCPDLRIESIRMLKRTKKHVTIEYTLANRGKGPANIEGKTKGTEDNVAIKAYMTRSHRLSKGALVLGGGFVPDLHKSKNGFLNAGQSITATIKLETHNMTRFTPVVILELDTYDAIRECDETNNKNHVRVLPQ